MSMVKDRPSAAWRRRRSASSGMNRPIASSTRRSSWAGRTLCATWATWRSTYAAASIDRTMVSRATRRARHAGRSPLITRDQTHLQAVAELDGLAEVGLAGLGGSPIAAANSVTENSATRGAPGPATGIPVSPWSHTVAASARESTECIAAQATAACSLSASAASARAVLAPRAAASTAAAVSRSAAGLLVMT